MLLADQKMTTKVVLNRSCNFYCSAAKRVKRIGDNRVKTQTPGIMTLLPTRAASLGAASHR
jgi:hypothetical protein